MSYRLNTVSLILILSSIVMMSVSSCDNKTDILDIPSPKSNQHQENLIALPSDVYYDKVLGALVGSAIGDAMGASTEMWHRSQIQTTHGYITGLTTALRDKSPEGTWGHNLQKGTTTDDTRWKYLMTTYLTEYRQDLSPKSFAHIITEYYKSLAAPLSEKALENADSLDKQLDKLNWMIEWNAVANAYLEDPLKFQIAKNKFYGGEMSCAGTLYSPMFGLIFSDPNEAYSQAYDHALFDIGYAMDITALVAAMTSVAMRNSDVDTIIHAIDYIDPLHYKNSRLIGRLAEAQYLAGLEYVKNAELMKIDTQDVKSPMNYPHNNAEWIQQNYVYAQLESSEMPISFHAGEIWQILITGLKFGEGDFLKSIQFIVNFGRDNDTVAAIAGMILGAKDGFDKLPLDIKEEVIRVNREQLGIDLEELAREITLHSSIQ